MNVSDQLVRTISVSPNVVLLHIVSTLHYIDIIMTTMASQITSLTVVYSTVYPGADQRKKSRLRVTGLCAGNSPGTGEFPAQMASNAENVSIWWRHHDISFENVISYWFFASCPVHIVRYIMLHLTYLWDSFHERSLNPQFTSGEMFVILTMKIMVMLWYCVYCILSCITVLLAWTLKVETKLIFIGFQLQTPS